jgi:hypothetical protein
MAECIANILQPQITGHRRRTTGAYTHYRATGTTHSREADANESGEISKLSVSIGYGCNVILICPYKKAHSERTHQTWQGQARAKGIKISGQLLTVTGVGGVGWQGLKSVPETSTNLSSTAI